jgi:hydroxymethylglutaryl-CoA lyase
MLAPMKVSATTSPLPAAVRVREVGPRDGFQNEPELIPTEDKLRLIEMLAATGVDRLELTSFVRADVVPQLADAAEVLAAARIPARVATSVLVPTPRGLDRALELREQIDQVTVFVSASETHNRKNVNRSVDESMEGLVPMLARVADAELRPSVAISTAFGCPYEGVVPEQRVRDLAARLADAGAQEVIFGDTTGMANPVQVRGFFERMGEALDDRVELTAHFHNTRGSGLANALAAFEAGCESFESSFGELGGCPVPKGATGNIATEDLVSMLHEMGVATGIDLARLLDAAREAQRVLGRPLTSHTILAGPVAWGPAR